MKTHGQTAVAERLSKTKNKERQELLFKLSICGTKDEMEAVETHTLTGSKASKRQEGWYTPYALWQHMGVPPEGLETWKKRSLSKLRHKKASDSYCGRMRYADTDAIEDNVDDASDRFLVIASRSCCTSPAKASSFRLMLAES